MSMKVNWNAWVKLLTEDREWLAKQERTLERDHVIAILDDLLNTKQGRSYYDEIPEPWPPA